ncbi:acyl-CoA carboxylase subunit epsilon [Streptomyces sp. NPDC021080]|uniref:acyl-CoA carboxylase subunit epsilon n=1 Tax=Streptomyces sp. NPDC021080 TaxID=3365110 RepID=UPI0037ADF31D
MTSIKVLHGQPTPEELAAVLAVVSSRAAATAAAAAMGQQAGGGPASTWADRSAAVRRLPKPGRHAWRTSAWAQ